MLFAFCFISLPHWNIVGTQYVFVEWMNKWSVLTASLFECSVVFSLILFYFIFCCCFLIDFKVLLLLLYVILKKFYRPPGIDTDSSNVESMELLRVGHDWATSLSLFTVMHWRRKWQPTPVFLPGESQGRGSLMGCRLWGRTELDVTEAT